MALTPAQRKRNQRDRDAGLPETYKSEPKPTKEQIEDCERNHAVNYRWAEEQDEKGYYKSECRSCLDLLAIYEGANILDKETDDEETDAKKKSKKKENRPKPSQQKFTIRAVTKEVSIDLGDGTKITSTVLLEPNCPMEDRQLKEVNEVVSFQRWLDLRDKARKDLLWLGRLLGKGLFHSVHQYVCDQFVKKQFDGVYFKDYTLDDLHEAIAKQPRFANDGVTSTREAIILESRGAYKSTISNIDAVQWLINCPDIRVMIVTAFRHLAKKSAREIKRYFYLPLKAEPSAFQMLFPEYVLTGVDGRSEGPMQCPARQLNQKEDSLWVTSMESSSTGDHCDVLKGDDIVDPKNSADKEMREALKFAFDSIDADIRDPWGVTDITGTRYYTDDWYGTRQLPNPESGRTAPLRYSCRGCWKLSPEVEADYKSGKIKVIDILNQELGELIFPYKLNWRKLRDIYDKKHERGFKNQQLNEATDEESEDKYINQFNLDVLRAHSYPRASAPPDMEIIQCWDIAYTERRSSDFSVGATVGIYQRPDKQLGLVVLEVLADKWRSSDLARQMLAYYERHRPTKVYIEDANGVGFLMGNIKNLAQIHGSDIQSVIRIRPVSVKSNAKCSRVKDLEFLLGHDRLWFVNGAWIDETFKQLTQYTGGKSTAYRKDDIPDALSFATEHLPPTALMHNPDPKEVEKEHEKLMVKANKAAMYNRMFGTPVMPQAQLASEWTNRQRGGGGTPPAPVSQEPSVDPRQALLGRILPSGMRI
jgi:phage terminase large subunit-like protein